MLFRSDQRRDAELRVHELEKLDAEYRGQARAIEFLKEQISLAEKKMLDHELLQRSEAQSKQEAERLRERLLVAENRLQAVESLRSTQHGDVGGRLSCRAGGLGRGEPPQSRGPRRRPAPSCQPGPGENGGHLSCLHQSCRVTVGTRGGPS